MKKLLIVIVVLLIVACLCFAVYFTYAPITLEEEAPDYSALIRLPEPKPLPTLPDTEPEQETEPEPEPEPKPEPEPYICPIDFEALWERNPDIIAWLDIPNTDISYPIVQSPEDDTYYLNHNSDRKRSSLGALYSESAYNADDFSDLITVIYGHHMLDGSMFGNLQSLYSEANAMQDYALIRVFLPDRELDFEVFAAVPYSRTHILHSYGANDLRSKRIFQYEVSNTHSLDGRIVTERFPSPEDPVLILSTCLQSNRRNRFLVLARQIINQ